MWALNRELPLADARPRFHNLGAESNAIRENGIPQTVDFQELPDPVEANYLSRRVRIQPQKPLHDRLIPFPEERDVMIPDDKSDTVSGTAAIDS